MAEDDSLAGDLDRACFGAVFLFGIVVSALGVIVYKLVTYFV